MEVPQVDGLKLGKLIGHGGCGHVYQIHDANATARVVKIFDDSAISRRLLEKMTMRLETGGWPAGIMPVLAADFGAEVPYWITPMVAGEEEGVDPLPRNLQIWLHEHPGPASWKLVKSLARAIGRMHERRVAHANLKPGNIFFSEDGEVILADWALGNMPGLAQFHFTDAVLYQPPEQLRNAGGYLEEAGYRWDSFAFGVLAYRVLTGLFPRCNEIFEIVAPASGVSRRDGIQADLFKIARNLEVQTEVTWPDEAQNPLEAGFRGWIDRCLSLDPLVRPSSMIEVVAGFDALEAKAAADAEREALMDRRRRSDRRAWRTLFFAGAASATALVLGGLWHLTNSRLLLERGEHRKELTSFRSAGDAAEAEKEDAEIKRAQAEQAAIYERELGLARLEASRQVGDRLFAWAMEKGHRRLPPLDGRDLRLKQLERYYEDFLIRTANIPELKEERARMRLELSEISLAAGDAAGAAKRIHEALEAFSNLPVDADLKFRMATNALLLALLRQSNADPDAEAAFATARKALMDVPQAEIDADRLNQLLAILDFHEAKLLAAKGEDAQALEQLMRATQTLNRIADQRPDAAILRSELAACYLSSATILEGMGSLGDAREVRSLASVELVKLIKEKPGDFGLRLDLAGCYGAMAESAVLSGDITGAESISREAMKLLDKLVVEQPDNVEAVSRKASQLGLRAGILRDRGFSADAMKDYDEGIRMLEGIRASAPANATVSFRLALLWWQKGRMVGMSGNREAEITLIAKARDLLRKMESTPAQAGPRPEQLQSSGAYVLGDLGHSYQLAGHKQEAVEAFGDAVNLWQSLLKSRPQSEEYSEGLAWCRQRLEDLK